MKVLTESVFFSKGPLTIPHFSTTNKFRDCHSCLTDSRAGHVAAGCSWVKTVALCCPAQWYNIPPPTDFFEWKYIKSLACTLYNLVSVVIQCKLMLSCEPWRHVTFHVKKTAVTCPKLRRWWRHLAYKKVKWSRNRPSVAQRVGRGIALLYHDRDTRRWVGGQQHAPAALYPRERPGTHLTGDWVGPQGRSGRAENLLPAGIRSRTRPVQPILPYTVC